MREYRWKKAMEPFRLSRVILEAVLVCAFLGMLLHAFLGEPMFVGRCYYINCFVVGAH